MIKKSGFWDIIFFGAFLELHMAGIMKINDPKKHFLKQIFGHAYTREAVQANAPSVQKSIHCDEILTIFNTKSTEILSFNTN